MRRYIHMVVMCMAGMLCIPVHGQSVTFKETAVVHDGKERMSILVRMTPPVEEIKKGMEDWIKENYDFKLKGNGLFANRDVLTAEEVRIPEVSANNLNFYVKAVSRDNQTELSVFASLGYDIHINPKNYPREFNALIGMMKTFVGEFLPAWHRKNIAGSEELVAELSNEIASLEKDIGKNIQQQEKLQIELREMREALSNNQGDLEKAMVKLEKSKQDLKSVNEKLKIALKTN